MNTTATRSYIKRLNAWISTQNLALIQTETVRDLTAMEAARASELPAIDKAIAERKAHIAEVKKTVAIQRAKLATAA